MSTQHITFEAAIVAAEKNHQSRIAGVEMTRQAACSAAFAAYVAAGQLGSAYPTYAQAVAAAYATHDATIVASLAQRASDHDTALAVLRAADGVTAGAEIELT